MVLLVINVAEEAADDLNIKKSDTVFLSLPAVAKNSCLSKYISRTQSATKTLLRS